MGTGISVLENMRVKEERGREIRREVERSGSFGLIVADVRKMRRSASVADVMISSCWRPSMGSTGPGSALIRPRPHSFRPDPRSRPSRMFKESHIISRGVVLLNSTLCSHKLACIVHTDYTCRDHHRCNIFKISCRAKKDRFRFPKTSGLVSSRHAPGRLRLLTHGNAQQTDCHLNAGDGVKRRLDPVGHDPVVREKGQHKAEHVLEHE